MRLVHIVKNAPNSLIYAVTAIVMTVIVSFTVLAAIGADPTDLRNVLNVLLNVAAVALSGGGVIVAGAAAKSASAAERQTNGAMTQTIRDAVAAAMTEQADQPPEDPEPDVVT